jgi:hypothetical protein
LSTGSGKSGSIYGKIHELFFTAECTGKHGKQEYPPMRRLRKMKMDEKRIVAVPIDLPPANIFPGSIAHQGGTSGKFQR